MDDNQADSDMIGGGRNVVPERMLCRPWTAKKTNEMVLKEAEDKKATSNIFRPCNEQLLDTKSV